MLSINWGCFRGPCVFYPTEGISVILGCILEISFTLTTFWEPIRDNWNFKKKKKLNYT